MEIRIAKLYLMALENENELEGISQKVSVCGFVTLLQEISPFWLGGNSIGNYPASHVQPSRSEAFPLFVGVNSQAQTG